MEDLKPCPHCASDDVGFHYLMRKSCGVMVKCNGCGASGGISWATKGNGGVQGMEERAAALWNDRRLYEHE